MIQRKAVGPHSVATDTASTTLGMKEIGGEGLQTEVTYKDSNYSQNKRRGSTKEKRGEECHKIQGTCVLRQRTMFEAVDGMRSRISRARGARPKKEIVRHRSGGRKDDEVAEQPGNRTRRRDHQQKGLEQGFPTRPGTRGTTWY